MYVAMVKLLNGAYGSGLVLDISCTAFLSTEDAEALLDGESDMRSSFSALLGCQVGWCVYRLNAPSLLALV